MLAACFPADDNEYSGTGMIAGKVDIGPLCPVEPCNLPADSIDKIYDARKIIIYQSDSVTVVDSVSIKSDRTYEIRVWPGKYVVDINHIGIDSSSDVPKAVRVLAGQIVIVDISIDTGIR